MRGRAAIAAAVAALAAAPPALAANADVQAVDGPTGSGDNSWSPAAVSVKVGDTVTWHFNTLAAHNVKSTTANWSIDTPFKSSGGAPETYAFTAEGTYGFVCELHSEMTGTVTVGTPPPPPPPPLSEQPFANDQPAPTVFEVTDERRPRVSRVSAGGREGSARVRFRLDEPGRVTVRLQRGGRTVRSRTVALRRAGSRTLNLRGLSAGLYRVEVRARDLAGNRSRVKRASVRVR
jgi:plastocyanin